MDPVTLALLGIGTAARVGGNIAAGAQEFNRDDRERLRQLERQEAMGRLGMTPQERQSAQRQIMQPLQTIEREAASQRAAQMAGQDLGQGAAYRQMLIEDQVRQQGRLAAQQMLQQQQEAAIARDQAEIAQLEAQRRRRRQMMLGGGAEALASGAELGAQAYQQKLATDRQIQFDEDRLRLLEEMAQNQPPPNYVYPGFFGDFR